MTETISTDYWNNLLELKYDDESGDHTWYLRPWQSGIVHNPSGPAMWNDADEADATKHRWFFFGIEYFSEAAFQYAVVSHMVAWNMRPNRYQWWHANAHRKAIGETMQKYDLAPVNAAKTILMCVPPPKTVDRKQIDPEGHAALLKEQMFDKDKAERERKSNRVARSNMQRFLGLSKGK